MATFRMFKIAMNGRAPILENFCLFMNSSGLLWGGGGLIY